MRSRLAGVAIALWTSACLLACRPEPPASPRLVILYSVCTVNKRFLSPYASRVSYTPNLARFARAASVFTAHRTESGVSGTAYASIFSGTQADRHGVFKHPQALDPELYLIFEAFRDAGFETFYWADHAMASPELDYAQGVEPDHIHRKPLEGSDRAFRELLERLRDHPEQRALVVTAFSVTHAPWDLLHMKELRRRYPGVMAGVSTQEVNKYHALFKRNAFGLQSRFAETVARLGLSPADVERMATVLELVYASKIGLLDSLFGGVLVAVDDFGLGPDSVIAFTGDHGQQFFEPDRLFQWTHGPDLAPEVIDVPLLIKDHHHAAPPRRFGEVTRSIDVYPTLAGLAGVALPPDAVQGRDLSSAIRGEAPFPALRAYSHGTLRQWKYFDPDLIENIWASLRLEDRLFTWQHRDGSWRFVAEAVDRDGRRSPLDATEPPYRAAGEDLQRYREHMIEAFEQRFPDAARSKQEDLERLAPDEAEALRSLGYIE